MSHPFSYSSPSTVSTWHTYIPRYCHTSMLHGTAQPGTLNAPGA